MVLEVKKKAHIPFLCSLFSSQFSITSLYLIQIPTDLSTDILNPHLQARRAEVDELVKEMHHLTLDIGHEELARTLSELRNRINEPFMFVIVGEVKSGKSSFVNALLNTGKEVVKVAPDPCTDTIQQVIYGEREETIVLNPFLKKILLPVEILRDIAIVDTPGTNAIIEHHQQITEDFIPASDLIVFVFEAKNPYRQSAWDFFDYIHQDWRKKMVFILQQADLMSADDLAINVEGVKKQAIKKGIETPNVFAVSAKQELEGQKEESGYIPMRDYITTHITGGKAPMLKLQNNLQTLQTIGERIRSGLDDREAQLAADRQFRQEVKDTLEDQAQRSQHQVNLLVENLLAEYDRHTNEGKEMLGKELSFFSLAKRSFQSVFSKKPPIKTWLNELSTKLEQDLNNSFDKKLRQGVVDIAGSIQQMAKLIDLKIRQSETVLKHDHEVFGQIADKRSEVLQELQAQFGTFMDRSENFVGEAVFDQDPNFSPTMVKGSGIAAIGVALTVLANSTVLDVTGGLITGVGLLFAGATVSFKRRQILDEYQAEINKSRKRLEVDISDKLNHYIEDIKHKIDENFLNFDVLLDQEEAQLSKLNARYSAIASHIQRMRGEE